MFKDLPSLRLLKWLGGFVLAAVLIGWSYLFHFPYYSSIYIYLEEQAVYLVGILFLSLVGIQLIFIPLENFVRRLDRLNYYLQKIQRLGVELQGAENKEELFERVKSRVEEQLPYSDVALYRYESEEERCRLISGPDRGLQVIEASEILNSISAGQTRFRGPESPFVAWEWENVITLPLKGLEEEYYLLVLKVEKFSRYKTFHRLIAHRFGSRINEVLRQYSLRRRKEEEQERLSQKIEKATAELKRQREFLSTVLNSLDEGLLVVNNRQKVELINPRAKKLLELPSGGQNYDFEEIKSRLPREIIEETPRGSARLIETEGRYLEFEWQEVGGTEYRILLLRDRTRREKLQRRLQINETLEMMGEMASSVVHELRNPLGGMEMYVGLLKRRADNPELEKPVEKISEALRAIQRITEGLLNFTRAGEPKFEKLNLNQLINDVIEHCDPRLEESEVEVINDLPDLKKIEADVEQLRNVFVNLIQNAIEAQPGGGKIEITGENREGEIRISVRDYGEGISKEEQEEAFNRFFSTKKEGTGLGLAISKSLIEVHSGEIEVESTPGEGSVFSVILPISPVDLSGGEHQDEQ
ncbi:MAG: sensor histidine kinase [bacterium]